MSLFSYFSVCNLEDNSQHVQPSQPDQRVLFSVFNITTGKVNISANIYLELPLPPASSNTLQIALQVLHRSLGTQLLSATGLKVNATCFCLFVCFYNRTAQSGSNNCVSQYLIKNAEALCVLGKINLFQEVELHVCERS